MLIDTYKGIRPLSFFITEQGLDQVDSRLSSDGSIVVKNSLDKESTISNCMFTDLVGGKVAILDASSARVVIEFTDDTANNATSRNESEQNVVVVDPVVSRSRQQRRLQQDAKRPLNGMYANQALDLGSIINLLDSELVLSNAIITNNLGTDSLIKATNS